MERLIERTVRRSLVRALVIGTLALGVAACDGSSDAGQSSCGAPPGSACYNVTFTGLWTPADQPEDFPANAHFSSIIATTHNANARLWMNGGFATPGIESMAETGATATLEAEIATFVTAGDASGSFVGSVINATGSITLSIQTSEDFPLLSATSMIAPSPDWFVGLDSTSLRENGAWLERIERQLSPYDAGTDDGVTFGSANADSDPQDAIERILVSPFPDPTPPIASILIERVN